MKIAGLNSHVSCATYSFKTFYIKATCAKSSGLLLLLLLLLLLWIVKNVKESAMTSSEAFYLNKMSLGRHMKQELTDNHRVMMEFLISCITLQA